MLPRHPVSVQPLIHPLLREKAVELSILRLDQVHPEVSGNKFFKLQYNLEEAKKQGKDTLLTFGGAFSNHIHATASAAKLEGFESIGIIRGQELDGQNPTLIHAKNQGMTLHYVDRESYRQKDSPEFLEMLQAQFGDFYLIPEGGTNELAVRGTKEILDAAHAEYSHCCVSMGTGGTFAGLASRILSHQHLMGFSALKGDFIIQEMNRLLGKFGIRSAGTLEIQTEYHLGGYGKHQPALIGFMNWFYAEFQTPLDPIYTGKMAFGVWDLIIKNRFPPGSKILLIHTGGLQGIAGFNQKHGLRLPTL
jgi:1-aminocyclopropane-1-carboxylate deaminase/D-cysteine desulfhydrase-like pyridoxal-dependent ACC family enzyme